MQYNFPCRGYQRIAPGCEDVQEKKARTTTSSSATERRFVRESKTAAPGFVHRNDRTKKSHNQQNKTPGEIFLLKFLSTNR